MTGLPGYNVRYCCGGNTKTGRPCHNRSPVANGTQPGNCHVHTDQPVRDAPMCTYMWRDAFTQAGKPIRCRKPAVLDDTETDRLHSCATHRYKTPFRRTCKGRITTDTGEVRLCGQVFGWMPMTYQLCPLHEDNTDMPSVFADFPPEVRNMIVNLLRPADRVALALVSKACAAVLQTRTEIVRKVATGRMLQVYRVPKHHGLMVDDAPSVFQDPKDKGRWEELLDRSFHSHDLCFSRGYTLINSYWGNNNHFVVAARSCPFLFDSSAPRLCVACHEPLGTVFVATAARCHDFICQQCSLHAALHLSPWCDWCNGTLDPYVVSRCYWLIQAKGSNEERSFWYPQSGTLTPSHETKEDCLQDSQHYDEHLADVRHSREDCALCAFMYR